MLTLSDLSNSYYYYSRYMRHYVNGNMKLSMRVKMFLDLSRLVYCMVMRWDFNMYESVKARNESMLCCQPQASEFDRKVSDTKLLINPLANNMMWFDAVKKHQKLITILLKYEKYPNRNRLRIKIKRYFFERSGSA